MRSATTVNRDPIALLAALALLLFAGCGKASETADFRPDVTGSGGSAGQAMPGGAGGIDPGMAGQPDVPAEGPGGSGGEATAGAGGTAGAGVPVEGPAGTGGMGVISDPLGTAGDAPAPVFDAGSDPDRNKVSPGEICDRLATIQCAGEAYCCADPGRDFAACKQFMFAGCRDELMLDAVASRETVGFDPVAAEQAFTEYERKTSECDLSVADWAIRFDGLRSIIRGTVAPGESCLPTALAPGDEDEAAALASCADQENYACLPTAAVLWRCDPLSDAEGRCMTDANCRPGLYCDNPELKITGARCKTRKALGEGCELPNECATLMCKRGACVEATQQAVFCLAN